MERTVVVETVKKYWKELLAIVGALAAFFFYRKASSAEALLDNTEVKEKAAKLDGQAEANRVLTEEEAKRREAINEKADDEKGRHLNDKELADDLNRRF